MVIVLAIAVVVLALLAGFLAAGWIYAAKLIDRLTDKILARDYGDYQLGQAIKKDEGTEGEIMPHTDEAEAVIEEQRNQGLLKHIKAIDQEFANTIIP